MNAEARFNQYPQEISGDVEHSLGTSIILITHSWRNCREM